MAGSLHESADTLVAVVANVDVGNGRVGFEALVVWRKARRWSVESGGFRQREELGEPEENVSGDEAGMGGEVGVVNDQRSPVSSPAKHVGVPGLNVRQDGVASARLEPHGAKGALDDGGRISRRYEDEGAVAQAEKFRVKLVRLDGDHVNHALPSRRFPARAVF